MAGRAKVARAAQAVAEAANTPDTPGLTERSEAAAMVGRQAPMDQAMMVAPAAAVAVAAMTVVAVLVAARPTGVAAPVEIRRRRIVVHRL